MVAAEGVENIYNRVAGNTTAAVRPVSSSTAPKRPDIILPERDAEMVTVGSNNQVPTNL